MALNYALLGYLNLAPMTGYDLKKNLDRSTQHFWYAGLNQIYPTLKSLEDDGWIASRIEAQEGRPDRKVYRITDTGRSELLEWLAVPLQRLPSAKNSGLLKLFFSGYLERDQVLRQLRAQLELHRVQLEGYEQTKEMIRQVVDRHGLSRQGAFWELVRELGEEHERTYVRWLEGAIERVEGMSWEEER
jgi:DNA-binding PadR family transcriptional regulator